MRQYIYSFLLFILLFSAPFSLSASSVNEMACTNPSLNYSLNMDCQNSLFRATVYVGTNGTAAYYDVFYTVNGGTQMFLNSVLPGSNALTPYVAFGSSISFYVKDPIDSTCVATLLNLTQSANACCITPSFSWTSTPNCTTGLYSASFTLGAGTGMSYSVSRSVAGGPVTNLGTYGPGTHSAGLYFLGQIVQFTFTSLNSTYCSFNPVLSNTTVCNETCAQAQAISCGTVKSGHTNGAFPESPDPGTCVTTAGTGGAVWYRFTGSNSADPNASIGSPGDSVTLSTCNDTSATAGSASFDRKIRVFSASCGNFTCVGGDDDTPGCAALSSIVTIPTTVGIEYYVLVHGYASSVGTFFLSMDCTEPDQCTSPDSLRATIIYNGDVVLEWSQLGDQLGWEVEYGLNGFTLGTGTSVIITEPSLAIAGLLPNTVYQYYVRAQCLIEGVNSPWSVPNTFYPLPDLCSGISFTDSGTDSLYYEDDQDFTYELCPDNQGDTMAIQFTFVDLESSVFTSVPNGCYDFLSIFNGIGTADTLAAALCGRESTTGAQPWDPNSVLNVGDRFQSTDPSGCLTVKFYSDYVIRLIGWAADVECIPGPCLAPSDLDVVEIGFGSTNPRVNATWNNPEGTADCQVKGGRISGTTAGTANPQFANPNNTQTITQTNGSTVNFNISLYNNPSVPFVPGQTYGYEVRCYCENEAAYSPWSGLTPASTFVVPFGPGNAPASLTDKNLDGSSFQMTVVPNPNNGASFVLTLDQNLSGSSSIEIIDINGRMVWNERNATVTNLIDITPTHQLSEGIYVIRISSSQGVSQERFIVQ